MTADLYPRIRAAIEGRLELARAASPAPWHLNAEGDEVWAVDDVPVAEAFALSGNQQRATAAHIAANHPAFAIRALEADLSRLDRHAPIPLPKPMWLGPSVICAYEWGDGDGHLEAWAECPEIVALRAVYLEEEA